jgi:hypothetical protein
MTHYRAAAMDYLTTRRAMGYKLFYQGQLLEQFIGYLDAVGAEHLTIEHAVAWVKQPSDAARSWWAVRLSTVRAFARYLAALDPATEIPPAGLIPAPSSHRITPYIYTEDDVVALVAAAGRLPTAHLADTYQMTIGLLAVTGMRVGEVVRLDHEDVDLRQGQLTIRDSKFGKSRQIPANPPPPRRWPVMPTAATHDDPEPTVARPPIGQALRSSLPRPAPGYCGTTSAPCSHAWSAGPASRRPADAAQPDCTICGIASPSGR